MYHGIVVCGLILHLASDVTSFSFVCNLPAEAGPCRASLQRFFFDPQDGLCKTFIYGGCQGNDNRFATKQHCESTCIDDVATAGVNDTQIKDPKSSNESDSITTTQQPDICSLPADSGPCFANFPFFFFNSQSGQCESFVYGGCRGNGNRFGSVQACEQACRGPTFVSGSVSGPQFATPTKGRFLSRNNECNLPKAAGPCEAYIPSYFYNTQTGRCENFVYGGCQGNANRFASKLQCQQRCKAATTTRPGLNGACQLPRMVGQCRARFPRWFFDASTRSCRLFYYGGCGGNANNFVTRVACERLCVRTPAGRYEYFSLFQYLLMQLFGAWF